MSDILVFDVENVMVTVKKRYMGITVIFFLVQEKSNFWKKEVTYRKIMRK